MISNKEFEEFINLFDDVCKNSEKSINFDPWKIKGFIIELFSKNTPQKPEKVPFLSSKWGKCPNCKRLIKVQFYCPFCGQRVRERNYVLIDDSLNFGNDESMGINI